MKAEDLRIGNYFVGAHESNVPILQVKSFYENGVHSGMGKTHNFNLCLPIPLTEKWLIDLGGRLVCDNKGSGLKIIQLWIGMFLLESTFEDGFIHHSLNGKRIKLPNVHNLQNLVWILTGKELTK